MRLDQETIQRFKEGHPDAIEHLRRESPGKSTELSEGRVIRNFLDHTFVLQINFKPTR